MHDIGIIGTGIGGLHLGLYLLQRGIGLQRGIAPTLYAELPPDDMRKAPLPNTVTLLGTVREHMRALGVAHWDAPDTAIHDFDFSMKEVPEASFRVPIRAPMQFIDMRMYLPRLLEDFAARGGRVVTSGALDPADVAALAGAHDLVVVASGRGSLSSMFPRIAERSPHVEPRRRIFAGLFEGVRFPDPFRFSLRVVPEHGEVFEFQYLTFRGPVAGFLIEAVPGGALEGITHMRYEDDPAAFDRAMLELLREHVPQVYERIDDPAAFRALGPLHLRRGAIVPVVRHGVAALGSGRFALALGDAHITHDPILGQGANAAAKAAWLLGELLVARIEQGGALDEQFCTGAEQQLWELLRPIAEWSNAALMPPPPHVVELILAAGRDPAIAEEYVANFDHPARQWDLISRPEATAAYIAACATARSAPTLSPSPA